MLVLKYYIVHNNTFIKYLKTRENQKTTFFSKNQNRNQRPFAKSRFLGLCQFSKYRTFRAEKGFWGFKKVLIKGENHLYI